MVSEYWETYVTLGVYLASMFVVTIIANRQKRRDDKELSSHFLGSKNFGSAILLLTTFATVFSGYTVMGVPNEAGNMGFISIRWTCSILMLNVSLLLIFPRIRRLSILRNYESPGDFIEDRYRSVSLKILCVICTCLPQLIYFAVQLHVIGSLLSQLTLNELNFYYIIIVCGILIFIFEVCGGLRSVVYTDAIQASFMLFIFASLPVILTVFYGGFNGQVTDTETFNCQNSNNNSTGILSGCLNYMTKPITEDEDISEQYFIRQPSNIQAINCLLFGLSSLSFALNPHVLQRAFTASNDKNLKITMIGLCFSPLICMIPSILTGISYLSNYNGLSPENKERNAFEAILSILRDNGGFTSFISYSALLSGIGAIMSTADSSLIGVSNTVSVDIFYDWIYKNQNKNERSIVNIGKIVSLVMIGLCIGLACLFQSETIKNGKTDYGKYNVIQKGILWQAVPAYLFGLYTNINKKSVLTGIIIGICTDLLLVILSFTGNDLFTAIHPIFSSFDKSIYSLVSVALNLIACGVVQLILYIKDLNFPILSSKHYNPRFNGTLNIDKIRKLMKNIDEPITKFYGIPLFGSLICAALPAIFWFGEVDPILKEKFGDGVHDLLYNGKYVPVIVGFPLWAFITLMLISFGALLQLISAFTWSTIDSNYTNTLDDINLNSIQMLNNTNNNIDNKEELNSKLLL